MRVFLSWATEDSRYIAETLVKWLPKVLQAVKPWISTHIGKGEVSDGSIAAALKDSPIAILCLTKDSIESNYLHYEAGAIANLPHSHVCTFLYNLTHADIIQPLARFQHTVFEKEEVYLLLKTINTKLLEVGDTSINDELLKDTLNIHWPELEKKLKLTPKSADTTMVRSDREILEEILERIRFDSYAVDKEGNELKDNKAFIPRSLNLSLYLIESYMNTHPDDRYNLEGYLEDLQKFLFEITGLEYRLNWLAYHFDKILQKSL